MGVISVFLQRKHWVEMLVMIGKAIVIAL